MFTSDRPSRERLMSDNPYSSQRFDKFLEIEPELVRLYNLTLRAFQSYNKKHASTEASQDGFSLWGQTEYVVRNNVLQEIIVGQIGEVGQTCISFKSAAFKELSDIHALLVKMYHCDPTENEKHHKQEVGYCQTYGFIFMKSQEMPPLTLIYRNDGHTQSYCYKADYLNHNHITNNYDCKVVMKDVYDFLYRRELELTVPVASENKENIERKKIKI